MDRPYSSKARKSQGRITINSEASEKLKALFPEQSDTHLVSPFAENVVKEATELKTSITEGSGDNTCSRVKSLPKIVITPAESDTDLKTIAAAAKKRSQSLIKAPLLPNRLQIPTRIQSASTRRLSIPRPVVKVVSTTNLVVRQKPVGGNEKPNTVWHSGKPIVVTGSNSSSDGAETKIPSGTAPPEESTPIDVAKKPVKISKVVETEQISIDASTAIETESQTTNSDEDKTNESDIKQETPSQENIYTVNTTLFDQPHPTAKNVSSRTIYANKIDMSTPQINDDLTGEKKLTSEEMHVTEKVLAQFPSVIQRIRTARSRGAVIPPPDYDAEDSDDEYEEDSDSLSEDQKPNSIKCSSDESQKDTDSHIIDQQPSSSYSSSSEQSDVEEHEISSQQKNEVASSPTENTVVFKPISGGELNGVIYPPCVMPRYQRRSSFPQLATKFKGLPQAFSMPSLVNESPKSSVSNHKTDTQVQQLATSALPVITITAEEDKEATLSLLNAMSYQLKAMAGKCLPSDFLPMQAELSAALQPRGVLKRRREQTKSQLRNSLASRYAFTPLKMIIGELLLLHYDTMPTEISPMLNRSPSFVGDCIGSVDGLLSGRSSPKLGIPRRRYCGRMIHQHPLAKYIYRMKKPIRRFRDVYSESPSSDNSDEDDGGSSPIVEVYTPDQLAAKFGHNLKTEDGDHESLTKKEKEGEMPKQNSYVQQYAKKMSYEKVVKQSVPFSKPSSYLEMYQKRTTSKESPLTNAPHKESLNRGIQFSKKSVLPPIGVSSEQQQQFNFVPKPPLENPPTSGQFATLRKFRVKQLQNRSPQVTAKVVPAPLTIDTTNKQKEHAQKVNTIACNCSIFSVFFIV